MIDQTTKNTMKLTIVNHSYGFAENFMEITLTDYNIDHDRPFKMQCNWQLTIVFMVLLKEKKTCKITLTIYNIDHDRPNS